MEIIETNTSVLLINSLIVFKSICVGIWKPHAVLLYGLVASLAVSIMAVVILGIKYVAFKESNNENISFFFITQVTFIKSKL